MSFLHPEVPIKEKQDSYHPWHKSIKDRYSNTYKYGHNSAKNPTFPPKKEHEQKTKKALKKRVKLTIVGNRVTKDFIYCYYLVKGLHKYRPKEFEAPVIRGVSGVEWPKVLRDLKRQYGGLAYLVQSDAAVLLDDEVIGGREELKKYVRSRYIYNIKVDYGKEAIKQFASYINSSGRPCSYLHISINGECVGSLIFMLYSDIVPLTCENFLRLCETTKGGYSGTPVHRIVKDSWIQCGGFGLMSNANLDCENFIVPHDRRGVLCMANDGRNSDCSTQFFILLQPAPWMAHKYVAFGQLIEGEGTLRKIEAVPTWYESPTAEIIMYKAGVFNMNCQWMPINKNTGVYLHGHAENLNEIGEIFYEELLQKVFSAIQLNYLNKLRVANEVKEEMDTETYQRNGTESKTKVEDEPGPSAATSVNNDFDVDVYEYNAEEDIYHHTTEVGTPSAVVKPEKIFYIPFTDVPYPGETDSSYDLKKNRYFVLRTTKNSHHGSNNRSTKNEFTDSYHCAKQPLQRESFCDSHCDVEQRSTHSNDHILSSRFLKGDYCHEVDLEIAPAKTKLTRRLSIPADDLAFLFEAFTEEDDESSDSSLDSDDMKEIEDYLNQFMDSASFAGHTVKKMAHIHDKFVMFDHEKDEELKHKFLTDEELRLVRVAAREYRKTKSKKVSIMSHPGIAHSKINRRQTGFIHPEDLEDIIGLIRTSSKQKDFASDIDLGDDLDDLDEEELFRQVCKAPTSLRNINYGLSSFGLHADKSEAARPSVLAKLYDQVILSDDEEMPTLKHYKPHEARQSGKSFILLKNERMTSDEDSHRPKDRNLLRSDLPRPSIDQILGLQHGARFRKISTDYFKTIEILEQDVPISLRTLEYSKKRPSMSIQQYRLKNQQYQEEMKRNS